jgi:hypothetical protein
MGGIGMLAEQGGHSRGGRAVETEDGYVLTLRQRIYDHYVNSVSVVKTAVSNREGLLYYFVNAFAPESKKGSESAYLLHDNPDDYTRDVIRMLLQHGVEVERLNADQEVRGFEYRYGEAERRSFKAGDYLIRADQARHLFVNTLFRRNFAIEDSVMYDMSTWSIPQAYNLDAVWTESRITADSSPILNVPENETEVINPEGSYAFVIDWSQKKAPKALSKLWEMGYRVRAAGRSFTKDGKVFPRGSLIVLAGRNLEKADEISEDMKQIANNVGVRIQGFDTGRMDEGMDLGSRSSDVLKQPRVALMVDSPFSSYTAGQLWFLFDRWTEFGISRIRSSSINRIDLNSYDVLLLPGAGNLNDVLNKNQLEALKNWVRDGGTLIATESSAAFFTKQRSGFTDIELFEADQDSTEKDSEVYARTEDLERISGLKRIPGASMNAVLDTSHPLAYGMPEEVYSLKFNSSAFKPSTDYRVVGYYHRDESRVLASGYASEENKSALAGKAFVAHQPMGSGNVVLIQDNTQYRMFWVGPARIIQNAVMIVPSY